MGIDQRFCETLLARTPTRKRVGPVSPLLAKNVPPGRFLNARTLTGSNPAFSKNPARPARGPAGFLALLNENEPLSKKRSKKARFYAGFHQFLVQKMLTEQK